MILTKTYINVGLRTDEWCNKYFDVISISSSIEEKSSRRAEDNLKKPSRSTANWSISMGNSVTLFLTPFSSMEELIDITSKYLLHHSSVRRPTLIYVLVRIIEHHGKIWENISSVSYRSSHLRFSIWFLYDNSLRHERVKGCVYFM